MLWKHGRPPFGLLRSAESPLPIAACLSDALADHGVDATRAQSATTLIETEGLSLLFHRVIWENELGSLPSQSERLFLLTRKQMIHYFYAFSIDHF